uniref:AP-3 complex subunit delta-1 n=1 Tax=Cyanistes caeruleus TaxID=156563 RepID=A0A8C0VHX9_CYACU
MNGRAPGLHAGIFCNEIMIFPAGQQRLKGSLGCFLLSSPCSNDLFIAAVCSSLDCNTSPCSVIKQQRAALCFLILQLNPRGASDSSSCILQCLFGRFGLGCFQLCNIESSHGHPVCCRGEGHHHPGQTRLVWGELPGGDRADPGQNPIREQQTDLFPWQDFERSRAFTFLNEIKKRFQTTYGSRAQTALPYAMNSEFSSVLAAQLKYHSESKGPDQVAETQAQIDELKGIMVRNIDLVAQRGEKLELLIDKTENLVDSSVTFKTTSRNLARAMCMKNLKLTIVIIIVSIVILYIILSAICGGLAWPSCVQ